MADSKEVFKPGWRALDANGNVLSGAYVECYEAGTDTARDLYYDVTDSDVEDWLSIGPVVTCDSGGYLTSDGNSKCVVYTGLNAYKLKLYTSTGVLVWQHDDIPGAIDTSSFGGDTTVLSPVSTVSSDQAPANSDNGTLYNVNCSGSDIIFTLPPAGGLTNGWRIGVRHNGSANQVRFVTSGGDLIGLPSLVSTTAFAITSRGQEVWIRSDQGGFIIGETTPPLLNTVGVINITDRLAVPPGSPQAGARYILTAGPSGLWSSFALHDIAEADGNGGWFRYTPATDCGWIAYVIDEDLSYQFVGSAWQLMVTKAATQAVQETGTSLVDVVVPGTQKHNRLHPKVAATVGVSGNLVEGSGVASVTDNATGDVSLTWTDSFSTATYEINVSAQASNNVVLRVVTQLAGSCRIFCVNLTPVSTDPTYYLVSAFGDV